MRIFRLTDGAEIVRILLNGDVQSISASSDGKYLYAKTIQGVVAQIDVRTGRVLMTFDFSASTPAPIP